VLARSVMKVWAFFRIMIDEERCGSGLRDYIITRKRKSKKEIMS
jgi:hypothetical protein